MCCLRVKEQYVQSNVMKLGNIYASDKVTKFTNVSIICHQFRLKDVVPKMLEVLSAEKVLSFGLDELQK